MASPDARAVLERAAVTDLNLVPDGEARTLIGAATRRELRQRSRLTDAAAIDEDRAARLDAEALTDTDKARALAAAESLLGWRHRRAEEPTGGV